MPDKKFTFSEIYSLFDIRRLSELYFKSDFEKAKTISELMLLLYGFMLVLIFIVRPESNIVVREHYDPKLSDFVLACTVIFGSLVLFFRLLLIFLRNSEALIKLLLLVLVISIAISLPLILAPSGIFDAVIWMIAFTFTIIGLVVFSYKYMILPLAVMLSTFVLMVFGHEYLPFKLRAYILGEHSFIAEMKTHELLVHYFILTTILIVTVSIIAFLTTKFQHREKQLRTIAEIDPLTGIMNRRSIIGFLENELAKSIEQGIPLSVAMLDLDFFKSINDKYGHPFGDKALKQVAGETQALIRSTDAVGRYGGEEFLLVFTNCGGRNAVEKLNVLRKNLSEKPLSTDDGLEVVIKLSAGVAESLNSEPDIENLISIADKNLYRAKEQGRDQVVFSDHS